MSITFAIIGCGRISKRHAEQIVKVGKLVAVCDVVKEKADELAFQYGVKAYYSLNSLLVAEKGLQLISICTPNGLHAAQSIACLQMGINVLCEKPLSINYHDGVKMIMAANDANKKLYVVKSARYNPLVVAIKQLILENKLGTIFSFNLNCVWNRPDNYYQDDWRGTLELDGGSLYTQFSHYIDILIWLFGEHKQMNGFRTNVHHQKSIEFEDTGVIALTMQSNAIGSIHYSVNAYEKNQEISLNIIAENGTITLGGSYMNEIKYQCPVLIKESLVNKVNDANEYGFYKGSASNHDKVYENIVKALAGQKNDVTDASEALKTVQFIEQFYNLVKLT